MSGFYGTAAAASSAVRPRTTGVAASFLDKINQKAKKAQEPDQEGYCTVVIERRHKGEPLAELGLSLTPDAEVTAVAPNSRGAEANVPVHYVIFRVNDAYVETDAEFFEAAAGAVRLVVKLFTAADMKELLAKVQGEVMPDLEDLSKTAVRYSFLKIDHPVHTRWSKRLEQCLEAKRALQLIQAELAAQQQEAEEQEAQRRLEELVGGSSDDEKEALSSAVPTPHQTISPPPEGAAGGRTRKITSIITEPIVDDSAFGFSDDVSKDELLAIISAAAPMLPPQPSTTGLLSTPPPEPLTVGELRDIVGLPVIVPDTWTAALPPPPAFPSSSSLVHSDGFGGNNNHVSVLVRVKQEYKLSNGSVVSVAIKERHGPLPSPPSQEPPPLPEPVDESANPPAARVAGRPVPDDYVCHACKTKGHWIDDCPTRAERKAKKDAPPVSAPPPTSRSEICKDYQRGKCTRSQCIFRHIDPEGTKGTRRDASRGDSRDRKRSRSRRDRSREPRSKRDERGEKTKYRRKSSSRSRDEPKARKPSRDEWSSRHKRL